MMFAERVLLKALVERLREVHRPPAVTLDERGHGMTRQQVDRALDRAARYSDETADWHLREAEALRRHAERLREEQRQRARPALRVVR